MTNLRAATITPRERLAVASRIVAAIAGGYAVAALATIAIGTLLPATANTATISSALVGLLLMPIAAMACFRARTAARAWVGTIAAAALFAGLALAGGWRP